MCICCKDATANVTTSEARSGVGWRRVNRITTSEASFTSVMKKTKEGREDFAERREILKMGKADVA